MRIGTTTFSTNLLNELNRLNQHQTKLSERLSTQSKVNKVGDSPLAYAEITQYQSRSRAMQSYRANLDRAQLISNLSKQSVNLLKSALAESIDAATLLNTTIKDSERMQGNVDLMNMLIDQALLAINTKEGEDSLFAGSHVKVDQAFNIARDDDDNVMVEIGGIRQELGDPPPQLIQGNYYRIEDSNGVDFRVAGADSNEIGTVFEYNGQDIDWIPGSGAALTPVSANIKESSKDRLVEGRAYEIVAIGDNTELRDSGASVNALGHQFVYNGKFPTTWDGLELAALVTDYDEPITEHELEAYEYYRIVEGSTTAFENVATTGILDNQHFQYNGQPLSSEDDEGGVVKLAKPLQQGEEAFLVSGQAYQIIDSDGTFAGGGAPLGAQTGDVFIYDENQAITDWGDAKLLPIELDQGAAVAAGPLVDGQQYYINQLGGSTNFADLSVPPNDGQIGTVFTYSSAGTPVPDFGTGGELVPLEASVDPGSLTLLEVGQPYAVVGGNGTLTGGGAGINAQPGTRFIYDGTTFQPADFGGATLTPLTDDPNADSDLVLNNLYKVGYLGRAGMELPALSDGDELIAGKTYRVESLGDSTNFLTSGGANIGNPQPTQVGDIFVANGAQPADFDGAQLKPMVLQTADTISGSELEVGRSYQIKTSTAAGSREYILGETHYLSEGLQYTITDNGSSADFSAVTVGGTGVKPDVGTIIQINGAYDPNTDAASVNYADAVLVEVDASGGVIDSTPVTDAVNLKAGSFYQIVDNGSQADFTLSGAPNNNTGTTFTYNGIGPAWGSGKLQFDYPASDFTAVGAPDNNAGTSFTATDEIPEWGQGAELYVYRPEFTQEADLTDIGALVNEIGEIFNYNGSAPVFDNANGAGTTLFGYKREVAAAEYAGSDTNAEGFTIAQDIKMSPYSLASDNQRFADVINSMISLREAFQMAADADPDDEVAFWASRERLSEAAQALGDAQGDVNVAAGNMDMNDLELEIAANKDDHLYNNLQDIIDQRKAVDQAELITKITQAETAYETALSTGAQLGRLNLFDFL